MPSSSKANMVAPILRSLMVDGKRVCLRPVTVAGYNASASINMTLLSNLGRVQCRRHYRPSANNSGEVYLARYHGKFDYHDQLKYPKTFSKLKEEELLDEVHAIRALEIENPSPFHVVRRIRSIGPLPWNQKVTLRRLNLHSTFNGECVVVPNTPQFNELIAKVKHVLNLKPAKFADGRIPTEDDIGAIKVCPYTGNISIDEKLRLRAQRLNLEKPPLFQGNFLRAKINRLQGIHHNHFMR